MVENIFNQSTINQLKSIFNKTVIITDDGHGWFTRGKRSFTDPPMHENEFNSILEAKVLFLLDILEVEHYQLAPGELDAELNKRGSLEHDIYEDAKGRGKKCLMVSMHCDAYQPDGRSVQNDAHGFTVFYHRNPATEAVSAEGKRLARAMADSIIATDQRYHFKITPRQDHGIYHANFYVLRETYSPAILIENGFMTNDEELAVLRDDHFRNARAMAIIEGFYKYLIQH